MTEIRDEELLFWCDVETTGTNAENDMLLQVAAYVKDIKGNMIVEPFEYVVKQNPEKAYSLATPFVQEMHSRSGLWEKLKNGKPCSKIDAEISQKFSKAGILKKQLRLAGNSVRLDLNFVEKNLPEVYSWLTYRMLDVSTLAYWAVSEGLVSNYFEKAKTHNAVDDIRESEAEYQWITDTIKEKLKKD